jgi:NitT/TauT family transport system substrate-binding protein
MSMTTAWRTVAIAAVMAGLGAAPVRAAELKPFNMGISAQVITIFPVWMGQAGGFYEKEGLKVDIISMEGGSRGIQVLLSGDIQAMHVGLAPVLPANKHGADLRLIASSTNTIPFTIFSPPNVKSGADLKGSMVGVSSFASESDVAVTLALKQLGLTRDDVTIIKLGGTSQRFAALMSGQVKAVPLIEPTTTRAREGGYYPLVDLAAAKVPWIFDAVVVTRSYLAAHRDEFKHFLKAYIEGAYLALGDEKRGKAEIANWFKATDPKVIDATYQDFKRLMPLDFEPSRAGAANVIEQLKGIGTEIGSTNPDDYLDTGIIEELKKEGFFAALKQKYRL